jgi:large subunit ribosomal protein L13
MKTFLAKKETLPQPKWYLIDADGAVLGRLAVKVANILRGRTSPPIRPRRYR